MTDRNRKLQETAKSLGVSPRVIEQYLALKAAEVAPRTTEAQVIFQGSRLQKPKPKA